MKKRRFPRMSATAVRRMVLVLIALTALLCAGCSAEEYLDYGTTACPSCNVQVASLFTHTATCHIEGHYWCDDDHPWCESCRGHVCLDKHTPLSCGTHCQKVPEAEWPNHEKCTLCNGYLCTGGHGDGVCNKKEEPPQEQPKEEQLMIQVQAYATCPGCKDTVAATTAHLAACGDHYTCAEGYSAEDHADCSCGEPYCDGHVHVSTSKPRCPSCNEKVSAKNAHLGACGDHYTCDPTAGEAGSHDAWADCEVHYSCVVTNDCAKCVCGAVKCDAGFKAEDHEVLTCGTHHECVPDGATHDKCGCGKYECDGTDHTGHTLLTCGEHFSQPETDYQGNPVDRIYHIYDGGSNAGSLADDQGTGGHEANKGCGLDGHYYCTPGMHVKCAVANCDKYTCTDSAHAVLACSVHYKCGDTLCYAHNIENEQVTEDIPEENHIQCDFCKKTKCADNDYGAESDHDLTGCGHRVRKCMAIYDGVDHNAADCGQDGHYKCDGSDHTLCTASP